MREIIYIENKKVFALIEYKNNEVIVKIIK